ncbi:hypothetical protein QAD02_023942 [Eretmocerus hayati]|uniref:Uncharacterized protein n=1 Tax=Eretmocerus hayati TaxID=131215 RepID=A0ACC2PXF3_9HYME|nr:hypothetical protein QAD02_023942 [Eretmocerus hayati]
MLLHLRLEPTTSVRRNPLRSAQVQAKNEQQQEITRQRAPRKQRLLVSRRHLQQGNAGRNSSGASTSSSSAAATAAAAAANYMNTRSVTRKLHNVGATYRAPTAREYNKWRDWPIHGMHERPVYHPKFGLAAEYNGRLFASLGNEGYKEITPDTQVVRVDPRLGSAPSSPATQLRKIESLCPAPALAATADSSKCNANVPASKAAATTSTAQTTVTLPQAAFTATAPTSGRLLSKEQLLRSLQQNAATSSPSKCLIVPRTSASTVANSTTPVALPFCNVQPIKANGKGKLWFVRAPDTAKKVAPERTSTVTSASATNSISWAEISLRRRLEGAAAIARATSVKPTPKLQPQQTSRGFPPLRLAESTGMFRPSQKPAIAPESRSSIAPADDQLSEVLDLSKKDTVSSVDTTSNQSKGTLPNVSKAFATDLVRYFQNFGADESMDSCEASKNIT